ncbi:hypothetical protein GGR56DRAFT_391015 [Xylariaceae sp. FL0804]|nr:hypothetical protein GGR56DRAFT_391015 [Xylariaceae sp. FL0804]
MRGFFVIRCTWPKCPHHFFTDAPLAYNRALRHFLKHGVTAPEVTPGKARKSAQGQAQLDEIARKHREIEEDFTTAPEPQDSLQLDDSDYDADERPRRTPRSVPRPDYAEIVANKDSWNESDAESELGHHEAPVDQVPSRAKDGGDPAHRYQQQQRHQNI